MSVNWGANWPTLTLQISFDGFSFEDVSAYVRDCYTNRGSSRETGRYPPGTMTVTLDNRDGRFSPFNLSGPYVSGGATQVLPGVRVGLTATWASVDYQLFYGQAEDWQDEYPEMGYDAVTVLTCVDPLALLASNDRVAGSLVGEGELSGARINRILTGFGLAASVQDGDNYLQATNLGGNALDECYRVVDSEGGALWYDPSPSISSSGGVVFEGRSSLVLSARSNTSQVTFGTGGVGVSEFTTTAGADQVVRTASYANVGGAVQTVGSGLPAKKRLDLIGVSDADAHALASLAVAVGDPAEAPRVTSVTVPAVKVPATNWPHVLGRRIRDRATVNLTIPSSGLTITRGVFIDGVSHSISPLEWTTRFEFASASAWDGFTGSQFDVGAFDVDDFFF